MISIDNIINNIFWINEVMRKTSHCTDVKHQVIWGFSCFKDALISEPWLQIHFTTTNTATQTSFATSFFVDNNCGFFIVLRYPFVLQSLFHMWAHVLSSGVTWVFETHSLISEFSHSVTFHWKQIVSDTTRKYFRIHDLADTSIEEYKTCKTFNLICFIHFSNS